MGVGQMLVDPFRAARRWPVCHLPCRQHDLPVLAVDRVPVHVDVGELVIGPDLLELGEAREQRPVVPEPDVLDGEAVTLERRRGQPLLGGEIVLLDRVEPVRLSRHADVALDVRALGDELVGRDLEALEQRRPDAQAPPPTTTPRTTRPPPGSPPGPRDRKTQRGRAQEASAVSALQSRERGVDVGRRRGETTPRGRRPARSGRARIGGAKEQGPRPVPREVRLRPPPDVAPGRSGPGSAAGRRSPRSEQQLPMTRVIARRRGSARAAAGRRRRRGLGRREGPWCRRAWR